MSDPPGAGPAADRGPAGGTVVVVADGDPPSADAAAGLHASCVVAADGGTAHAHRLGLRVDLAVGDADSATASDLARVVAEGGRVERHPVAKDATDLALALDAALRCRPDRIVVLGGHGGRADHWFANLLLLAAPAYAGVRVEARMGPAAVTVVRPGSGPDGAAELTGTPGDTLSLLPVHGGAAGVTTEGLRYPLRGEDLPAGSTRGVSNVFLRPTATVSLIAGVLLAVQPGPVD